MKLIENIIKSMIFIPVILALVFAASSNRLVATIENLIGKNLSTTTIIVGGSVFIFIAVTAYFLVLRYLIRTGLLVRAREKKFRLLVLTGSLSISLVSVLLIDSNLFSDFEKYHETALDIYTGKISFQYVFDNLWNVYLRRVLVNLVPTYMVFGPSLLAVQFVNIFLHLATGFMLYSFLKENIKSITIARISLIFYFSIPIAYLTLNIPSHDVTGLFYLMVCFFIFGKINKQITLNKNIIIVALLSLALGFMIFVLEMSRSIGTFMFYSLTLLLLSTLAMFVFERFSKPRLIETSKKVVFLFIIPLLIYYTMKHELISGGLNKGRFIMMFIASDTSDDNEGAYSEIADYKRYYSLIEKNERADVSLGKYASELHYNYPSYLKMLVRKNNRLSRLGEDFSWSQTNNNKNLIWTIIAGHWILTIMLKVILFLFAALGLLYLYKRYRVTNPLIIIILTWLITLVILIFLGEVSPRYVYLFLLCLPVLAAIGFVRGQTMIRKTLFAIKDRSTWSKPGNISFIFSLVIALLIYVFLFSLVKNSLEKEELIYKDLREMHMSEKDILYSDAFKINSKISKQERPLKFGMSLADTLTTAEAHWSFASEQGKRYKVRGFIREKVERPKSVETILTINDQRVVDSDANSIRMKQLKVLDKYRAGYFSSDVFEAKSDSIFVTLSLNNSSSKRSGRIPPGSSDTYLEFLQIVEIEDSPVK